VPSLDDNLVEVVILPRRRLRGDGGEVHLPGDVIRIDEDAADMLNARGVVAYALNPSTVARVRSERRIPATEADFAALDPDDRDLSDPVQVARRASGRRAAARKPRAR
jgi:hypothetical protein